jgi:hypothetical protein
VDFLRLPLTSVAFHDPEKGFRTVSRGIKAANGITAEKSGDRVFVSAIVGGVSLPNTPPNKGNTSLPTQRDQRPKIPAINRTRLSPRQSLSPPTACALTLALTPEGDLLVTGVPVVRTALDHSPSTLSHSKVVRIALGQLGDTFFGSGSGHTAAPIIEPVLMDATGKVNASTTAVEVSIGGRRELYVTSWRSVGLTRCKLP